MSKKDKHFAKTHARTTDPSTSHMAAARAPSLAKQHCALIHEILMRLAPLTAEEVSCCCDLSHAQVSRRLVDLRKDSKIMDSGFKRLTSADRWAIVWRPI